MDVGDWLRTLGLGQYEAAFRENEIDAEVLPELTDQHLKDLGVALGHRLKMLRAIRELAAKTAIKSDLGFTPEPQAQATAERRQLTVMFCDLVGSTALAAQLDPEDLRDVIGAYHRRVTKVVGRYDGFVAKYMGDGVLVYFGYPQAHEDDAERAVRAGLKLVGTMDTVPSSTETALQIRVGIATGLVVVGDLIGSGEAKEHGIVGETPNLAARLQGIAEPNTVVIAEGTRKLIGNLFELADLGPKELKGINGPVPAWSPLRAGSAEGRFEAMHATGFTELVGREEELELLLRRWSRAKTGEGQVALLSAEPGIGKSRLIEELLERVAVEQPITIRYFCSPHHQDSAFYPVIGQLERAAGFTRGDAPCIKREKLAANLRKSSSAEEDLPIFAELLSLPGLAPGSTVELPPQRKKELTLEALLRQFQSLARRAPTIIVFEDLHWIDATTRELLDRVIALIEQLPVLLIATFRPEFQPPWIGQAHVTMLALTRLDRQRGAALVRQLGAHAVALSSSTVEEIVERGDGVPLFLEEITKVVLENAALGEIAGKSRLRSGAISVPPTLQASLLSRLDRLGLTSREVAQTGAAIGRNFSYELVAAVCQRDETETTDALGRLVQSGLVFQRGAPPAAEYQFKHALVQDTAYGTLLRSARLALHSRIAATMRVRSPEIVERSPEVLAHHLTEAGELDTAANYWLEAGRRAVQQSANIEAAAHLIRGIATLAGRPQTRECERQELALQLTLGPALLSNEGYGSPGAKAAYLRAATLADRLEDDRARFAASWGLWITAASSLSNVEVQLEHLGALIEISERISDPELILQAHHSAWATYVFRGELERSVQHVQKGLALYDPQKHRHHGLIYGGHDPAVCGKGFNALLLWLLGYPDQAAQSAADSVAVAEGLGHVPSLLHSLWFAGVFHCVARNPETARHHGERLLRLAREHKLAQYEAVGGIIRGRASAELGHHDGLSEIRSSLRDYGEGTRFMLDLFSALLAEIELSAGQFEHARTALASASGADMLFWRSDLLRVKGDLHRIGANENSAAQACYLEAITVAQAQQAKSFELRAAVSIARLWCEQGKRMEARNLLAPVYSWFTEGFDTPDLREAKALLDEFTMRS